MSRFVYVIQWFAWSGGVFGAETSFEYATRDFVTSPAYGSGVNYGPDANTTHEGRMQGFPEFESSRFEGTKTGGGPGMDGGRVVLSNGDGELDTLLDTQCDGRIARIFSIDLETEDTDVIWFGLADGYEADESTITLKLQGFQSILDRTLMVNKFAGTGGLEGTADDLKGKVKPMMLGKRYNIAPPRVNTAKEIYQIDGQMGVFYTGYSISVYDQRSALSSGGTYASLADLQDNALAPAAGAYKLFPGPAGVYIRLGSVPVGKVTCDVTNPGLYAGHNIFSSYAAGYSTKCEAQWLVSILLQWLQVNVMTPSFPAALTLDDDAINSWVKFTNPANQEAGIFIDQDITFRDALTPLLQACGASLHFAQVGQTIHCNIAQIDVSPTSTVEVAEADVVRGSFRLSKPSDPEAGVPFKKLTINYRKNHTVMSPTELAGSVSAADVVTLGEEWLSVSVDGSAFVLSAHLSAPSLVIDTALQEAAGAEDLRDDVLTALYSFELRVVEVEVDLQQFVSDYLLVKVHPFRTDHGITLDYPRYGCDGVPLPILSYSLTSKGTVRLALLLRLD